MLLELKNLGKSFKISKKQSYEALKDINISFDKGEFVTIVGPSGSGKSTLLNIIAGLDFPTSGELVINNESSKKFKQRHWDLYRKNNIGFVFQNFNLIEHLTALENVEIVMNLIGLSYTKRRERAIELLKKVGLEEHIHHKPSELSGGQKQRVAVARALANDPDIILADEPTGALDKRTGRQIMELIKSIAHDKLIIMVTHNNILADEYSSRIIKLRDGKIESEELKKEVIKNNEKSTLKKKNTAMSFYESFKLSLRNMKNKIGRVTITTIAGCIGIIGLTLIAGLGNGANIHIDKQLNKFGNANVLILVKNVSQNVDGKTIIAPTSNKQDYNEILNDEYIKSKVSLIRNHINLQGAIVKFNNDSEEKELKETSINALADLNNINFLLEHITGKLPNEGNNEILVNQVVARKLLNGEKDIKQVIGKTVELIISIPNTEINYTKEFQISGIVNEIDLGVQNIYYNYSDMQNWLQTIDVLNTNLFDMITTKHYVYELVVTDVNDIKLVSDYIASEERGGTGKLSMMDFNASKEGFTAGNMAIGIKHVFAQLIMIAQIVISIFIIISLVVSGIMTSIVLYSSIIERKTEIGIIKAVGGRNKDVIRIFESEALLMGLFSGVLGLVIAFILAPILENLISKVLNIELPGIVTIPINTIPFTNISFPFATIIVILLFSSAVSSLAGYMPSRKATKLHVIDALRDE